jgi:hypothetical protein
LYQTAWLAESFKQALISSGIDQLAALLARLIG